MGKLRFYLLQDPFIGQFEQPHEQEDFPFFLFLTILKIIAATTAISTTQTIIVAEFSESHASIPFPPFPFYSAALTFLVSLVDSEYLLKNNIYKITASTAIAAIKPIIFKFPVSAEPN